MKRLFAKLFLAGFPLLGVIVLYLCVDPFKVLYHYDSLFQQEASGHISLNRDYVSTEQFLKNYNKYKYDSYIFGNSRSGYYPVREWQKHIHATASTHYDAFVESLFGVERKVEFLHNRGVKIRNALFVIDNELLGVAVNQTGPLYRKHPLISGESTLDFQLSMFKYFLDADFITAYIRYLFTKKITPDMYEKGFSDNASIWHYDDATNEVTAPGLETAITENRDSFYNGKAKLFYKRDTIQQYADPVIKQVQINMLHSIKQVLDADTTNYKIVISPLYNQKKISPADLSILQTIFGKEHVYDFSGINEMTQSIYNYYETSHYRPQVAIQIMDSIYRN